MTRKFLLLLFLIISCSTLYPSIAFKAGINSSNMHFSGMDGQDWGSITGLRVGVFYTSSYSKRLSLQPEIYFVTKGVQTKWNFMGHTAAEKLTLSYIEIPLLLRYSIIKKEKFNIGLFTGAYIAYNLSAIQLTKIDNESVEENIGEDIENRDYGGVLGIEAFLIKNKYRVYFDFRLTKGLANIREGLNINESIENYSLSFMIGLGF